jgi:transposase
MQTITTIGFDIAKSVYQVHGVDVTGEVVIRRQLKRRHVLAFFEKLPPCLVGIEACASSHHWSREPGCRARARPTSSVRGKATVLPTTCGGVPPNWGQARRRHGTHDAY